MMFRNEKALQKKIQTFFFPFFFRFFFFVPHSKRCPPLFWDRTHPISEESTQGWCVEIVRGKGGKKTRVKKKVWREKEKKKLETWDQFTSPHSFLLAPFCWLDILVLRFLSFLFFFSFSIFETKIDLFCWCNCFDRPDQDHSGTQGNGLKSPPYTTPYMMYMIHMIFSIQQVFFHDDNDEVYSILTFSSRTRSS